MAITKAQLKNWFTYHAPKPASLQEGPRFGLSDQDCYQKLRDKAHELAIMIVELTPEGADQSAAIRQLRECMMTANASIACSYLDAYVADQKT